MAKQPKLDYDTIETLYQYGYNTKEIASLVGSVNGHISKVLRHIGVTMRKRGEIVDKVNFHDMESEAQTLLKDLKEHLDEMYVAWTRKPSVQKRLGTTTAVVEPMAVTPSQVLVEQAKEVVAERNEPQAPQKDLQVEPVEEVVAPAIDLLEALETGVVDVEQLEQVEAYEEQPQEEVVEAEDKYQLEEETTEEGHKILRGEDFKGAELNVQGSIIKHFLNQGMAQRPIANELGIAQSNVSRIWTKYRKVVGK
ncbi:hypothetical protein [Bacillus thuringiensis]|uniref:hypothetical protein n=1 Tax=Bacillus thuringiensis TaxID=1428 RepID=UPI000BFD07F8|nr:hypothetical protein [Bacillus thuringiensis]PGT89921.1 hypothetical protein COD17_09225 [Bacillus thuringiensis]